MVVAGRAVSMLPSGAASWGMDTTAAATATMTPLSGLLLLVLLLPLMTDTSSDTDLLSICQFQTFNASCKNNAVIVMTKAHYGRMNFGKCVNRDYGYVGCHGDVLPQLDRRCSGRRACAVAVPDETLHALQPCPQDLSAYMEASYICQPVQSTPVTSCINREAVLTKPKGFLASLTSMETGYGTDSCPWVITAKPGQQVNLTLYDFAPITRQGEYCRAYAIVREPGGQSHTVCSKQNRIEQAFLSKGNKLEVRMLNTRKLDADYFMLKYTVLGCPEYKPPPFSRAHLEGSHVVVTCNTTDQSWKLSCTDNKWIGPAPNCSAAGMWNIEGVLKKVVSLPFEVTLVLISSIAFVVVTVILVIGLLCLRRRRMRNEVPRVNPLLGDHPDKDAYSSGTIHGKHPKSYNYITIEQRNNKHRSFGEYASIWNSHGPTETHIFPPRSREQYPLPELPPAMGIVDDPVPVGYAGTPGIPLGDTSDPEMEHIYESPKFLRRERVDAHGSELPMYFELDPDGHPINTDRSTNNNNGDKRRTSDPGYHQHMT